MTSCSSASMGKVDNNKHNCTFIKIIHLHSLRSEMEDRCQLEGKIYSTEEKLRTVQGVLSQTQTLLLVERSNSQQLALHIDLLQVLLVLFQNLFLTYHYFGFIPLETT